MALVFPEMPPSKIYGEMTTPEQDVQMKLIRREAISPEEERVLEEAIAFYEKFYSYLKSIDLSSLDDADASALIDYFRKAITWNLYPKNGISFLDVYRVSFIRDNFLEDGKVRNIKFLTYPPKEIIAAQGIYGRANTPNSTVFYCAFFPGVAILESKPEKGQRIILTQWHNHTGKKFISSPVTNNSTIENENLKAATKAFKETMAYNHPLFARIMDKFFEFLSGEFVKSTKVQHPKKFEYLFSGLYSDWVLNMENEVDCLIYPSVAHQHKSENMAVRPTSVANLKPVKLQDCMVVQTMYDKADVSDNKLPVALEVIRESTQIVGEKIVWNDD